MSAAVVVMAFVLVLLVIASDMHSKEIADLRQRVNALEVAVQPRP